MICAGCGEPLEFHATQQLTEDGTRHVDCVCKCHEKRCTRKCFDDPKCDDQHQSLEPCKGQCGCEHCRQAYHDFLSYE